ncbi:MAG: carboxypeptidase regulatory-like domain-containing protein [Blastocatellia bacterium]|nr:carboxypeptidase regulatory-like domain-containing protein [Blastocatellia bacterium]
MPLYLALFLLLTVNVFQKDKCLCTPATPEDTTFLGWTEFVLSEKQNLKQITGTATIAAKFNEKTVPVSNVLVEVFDNPDIALTHNLDLKTRQEKQKRVAACFTGLDGKFCFNQIPKGSYEVRLSKQGYDPTSVIVNLVKRSAKYEDKTLHILMTVSQ